MDNIQGMQMLENNSIDFVMTSPPYANQRKDIYGGIDEEIYPEFTKTWMNEVKRIIKPNGNVIINIRPNLKNGQISDYVLKTILLLRNSGWGQCEELIWIKPDGAPLGSLNRPRRSYESLHWFSLNPRTCYCDVRANGQPSKRIGITSNKGFKAGYVNGVSELREGIARCKDYVEVPVGTVDKSEYNTHPAQYPEGLSDWTIKMLCPDNGTVLDPFCGSGTTVISCKNNDRNYIGFEISQEYCNIAEKRLEDLNKTQ